MPAGDGASKIYTRGGDKGKTSLIGGTRVSKSNHRLDAYGTIDELNSVLGLLIRDVKDDLRSQGQEAEPIAATLAWVQSDLFNIGSQLACEDAKLRATLPSIDDAAISALENAMDEMSLKLKPLKHFVLPGGSRSAAVAHVARTVCRRSERLIVALAEASGSGSAEDVAQEAAEVDPRLVTFINRLSDYLFVLARRLNSLLSIDEPIWSGKKQGGK